ncbi:MAG: LysR family transcriptional regulator [Clostridia bacterium]
MTFSQLEVLIAVVNTGSFSKAGDLLGMSQPGISHAIAGLEAELGITLLNRHRSGISLTAIGEKVMPHIRELMHQKDMIKQEVALEAGLQAGSLRIGSFASILSRWIPALIQSFQTTYPGISLTMVEGTYEEIRKWLADGTIHAGFLTLPMPNPDWDYVTLAADEMVALVPPHFSWETEADGSITLDQLAKVPFIMPTAGCQTLIGELFHDRQLHPHVQFEIRETATLLNMVREGVGASILPRLALPAQLADVSIASLAPQPVFRQIGLGVRSLLLASPATRAFLRHTEEWIKAREASL